MEGLSSAAWGVAFALLLAVSQLLSRLLARLEGSVGLREAALTDVSFARNAWCPLSWQSIKLRIGPDYKTRKAKAPTRSPLLECCGVDLFRVERKVVTSLGHAHAPYLPKEVMMAANGGECAGDLQKYLVVSISIPGYASSQADGPGIKLMWYFQIPEELGESTDPAALMLCEFLKGSEAGHATRESRYYDRFKVIGRLNILDRKPGLFLSAMIDNFNGKPMLWRWFGVWGSCARCGGVTILNLDFCTGGRLKNTAFTQGLRGMDACTFDLSWCLEARDDSEMPERLIGGATICRPELHKVPSLGWSPSTGRYKISFPTAEASGKNDSCAESIREQERRHRRTLRFSVLALLGALAGWLAVRGW